jgi:hypothetical protein
MPPLASFGTRQNAGPDLDTAQGANAYAQEWDNYTAQVGAALQASSGLEREKLAAQMKDAQAGRENAYKIAKLQADTQRYGYDTARQTALDQLKENARQFDASHALEKQKFGLDYAKTATDYLSTPDRYAQGIDFQRMVGRVLNNQGGPEPYGTGVTFQPKTEQDFAALANYGQDGSTPAGVDAGWTPPRADAPMESPKLVTTLPGGTAAPSAPMDPRLTTQPVSEWGGGGGVADTASPGGLAPTGNEQTTPDPRVKALKGILDAVPPSATPGHDNNDMAVMAAAQALYSTNLQPGALQRMRPDQQAILGSFIKRSGRSLNDWKADYDSYQPGQQSVRRA